VSNYELVYIITPEVSDEDLSETQNKISEWIGKFGGNTIEVLQWGRKKFSYPIQKFTEGNYIFTRLEMEPASIRELEKSLRLSDLILRHLLIRLKT